MVSARIRMVGSGPADTRPVSASHSSVHHETAAARRQMCVLHVVGELDAPGLTRLEDLCRAELELGTTDLVLDFTGMTGCPSALFMILSRTLSGFRRRGATVELVGLVEALTAIVRAG